MVRPSGVSRGPSGSCRDSPYARSTETSIVLPSGAPFSRLKESSMARTSLHPRGAPYVPKHSLGKLSSTQRPGGTSSRPPEKDTTGEPDAESSGPWMSLIPASRDSRVRSRAQTTTRSNRERSPGTGRRVTMSRSCAENRTVSSSRYVWSRDANDSGPKRDSRLNTSSSLNCSAGSRGSLMVRSVNRTRPGKARL